MIEEQIAALKASAKKQVQENQKLRAQYKEILVKRDEAIKDIQRRQDRIDEQEKQIEEREATISCTENALGDEYRQIDKLSKKLDGRVIQIEDKAKGANADIRAGRKELAEDTAQLAEDRESLEKLKASLDTRSDKLDKRANQLDQREEKIKDSLNKLDDEIAEATNGNKQVKEAKAGLATLRLKLKTKENEADSVKLKYTSLLNELTAREKKIKEMEEYQEEEALRLISLDTKIDRKIEINKLRRELNEQKTSN